MSDPLHGFDYSERVKPLMQQVVLLDAKRMEEIRSLRQQLEGAVRARELAQALVDLTDENTNIKGVHEVAAEIVTLLTPAAGGQ